jgi:hypothetical protein
MGHLASVAGMSPGRMGEGTECDTTASVPVLIAVEGMRHTPSKPIPYLDPFIYPNICLQNPIEPSAWISASPPPAYPEYISKQVFQGLWIYGNTKRTGHGTYALL